MAQFVKKKVLTSSSQYSHGKIDRKIAIEMKWDHNPRKSWV